MTSTTSTTRQRLKRAAAQPLPSMSVSHIPPKKRRRYGARPKSLATDTSILASAATPTMNADALETEGFRLMSAEEYEVAIDWSATRGLHAEKVIKTEVIEKAWTEAIVEGDEEPKPEPEVYRIPERDAELERMSTRVSLSFDSGCDLAVDHESSIPFSLSKR